MKKYTNKILVIAIAIVIAIITISFFIDLSKTGEEIKQSEINHQEGGQL